jgi:site-specific DNA-methyltransferase (adenine-specific)
MSSSAPFTLRGRNPDVLSCIANLSNDEVFTPPEFANRMLDTLAEGWAVSHNGADIPRPVALVGQKSQRR